jgi:hypothetical protein
MVADLSARRDPVVDLLDIGKVDGVRRIGGDSSQPPGQPIPLLLGKEALRITLVRCVGEEQGHDILGRSDFADPGIASAHLDQLDPASLLLKAFVHRRHLKVAHGAVIELMP